MTDAKGGSEGARPTSPSLTEAEIAFLDQYSGAHADPQALEDARAQTRYLQATTVMPDVPHLDEIIAALAAAGEATDPVSVVAFVTNAIIEVPGTDESYTVEEWLESGRSPALVLQLADQMKYGL